MTLHAERVQVGPTPTRLGRPGGTVRSGSSLALQAPIEIFVGGPGVTAQTGFPVVANTSFSVDLTEADQLYAVTASDTTTVSVLQAGV